MYIRMQSRTSGGMTSTTCLSASAPFANMPTVGVQGGSAARIAAVSTHDFPPYQRCPRPTHALPSTAVTDFRAGPQRVG